jgi:peroxiredoxin
VCAALLLLTGATAARAYLLAPQPDQRDITVWTQMGSQHVELGKRLPGFWLPDGRGGIVRTSDHAGKILLVYLFQADDLESTRMLPVLDRIGKEFREQGVQPIGVCISPDHADGWMFSRLGGYSFPIGSDIMATRRAPVPDSPIVSAYDLSLLPALVVTDRRRRVKEVLPELVPDPEALRRRVQARLAEEPE